MAQSMKTQSSTHDGNDVTATAYPLDGLPFL
jgi:hypothetical protein